MSILSRLFGSKSPAADDAAREEYKGFFIIPEPVKEGKNYRLAARIESEIDGEQKVHRLIRADTLESLDAANAAAIAKAKQMIDEQGVRLFG